MATKIKSEEDTWNSIASKWNSSEVVEIASDFTAGLTSAERVIAAAATIGYTLSINVTQTGINELGRRQGIMAVTTKAIHQEVDDLIDNPFVREVSDLLENVVALNPSDITITASYSPGVSEILSLSSLLSVMANSVDPALQSDFDAKVKLLDEDEVTEDMKKIILNALINGAVNGKGGIDIQNISDSEKGTLFEYFKLLYPELYKMFTGDYRPNLFDFMAPPLGLAAMRVIWMITMDKLSKGESMLGFQADTDQGIFYSTYDTWQKWLGYGHFYDWMFALGTLGNINRAKMDVNIEVDNNGVSVPYDLMLWFWKGNYLNLGAGTESGFYYSMGGSEVDPIAGATAGYFSHEDIILQGTKGGRDFTYPMTLTMYDKEKGKVFELDPKGESWWPAGFDPSYPSPNCNDLTAVTVVDFDENNDLDNQVYDAFKSKYDGHPERLEKNTTVKFDDDTHEMTIVFGNPKFVR